MHRCEFCFDTATMEEFIDHELNKREDDEEFNYCQWDTTDRATLAVITVTQEKYKETLTDVVDTGRNTKTFLYRQANNDQLLIQEEIQSYYWSKEY